jgi:hypothetical protein
MERGEGRERRVEREVPLPHVAHVNKSSSKLPQWPNIHNINSLVVKDFWFWSLNRQNKIEAIVGQKYVFCLF